MRKLVLIAGWLMLVLGAVAFGGPQVEGGSAPASGVSAPGVFPITKQKVTLRFFGVQDPRVQNLETTNWFTQYLENKTNVHIQWDLVPSAGLDEKRKLLLASGDYPDVLWGDGVTRDEMVTYGPSGAFVALNKLIDANAPELKKVFATHPGVKEAITAPDGNIYGMPFLSECYHCSLSQKMWVERDWLKTLGLKMPTTTDEFYAMLKAFKEKDPNGNGKADEIPLSGAFKGGWNSLPYDFPMNAFVYNDGDLHLMVNDGKVGFAANKPEWRDGLRYMNKLFKEGLVDPASFTQDAAQLQRLGENPDAVILGAAGGGWPGNFITWNSPSKRSTLYDILPPITGPKGQRNTGYYPQDPFAGNFVITKAAKTPEIAVKWADQFYTDEVTLMTSFGREGQEWNWASPGDIGINGKPAIWKMGTPLATPQAVTWYISGIFNNDARFRLGQAFPKDADPFDPANLELLLYRGSAQYETAKPKQYYPTIWMTKDVSNELTQLETAIKEYVSESTAKFIVGDMSIDSDWDSYVREFDKLNLARVLQIRQQAYDKLFKK